MVDLQTRTGSLTGRRLMALLSCALLMAGCGESRDAGDASSVGFGTTSDPGAEVVVEAGDTRVTLGEVEATIQLSLHDLAVERFRLLRQAAETAALAALDDSGGGEQAASIHLTPPTPPRLAVEAPADRLRPPADLPVTLVAFCNFESPHCARLEMTLAQVLPLFPGVVRYGMRDLPLAFHRHAGLAAEAARCALEQGKYWAFHDALFAGSGPPDEDRLRRAAGAAVLDLQRFDDCLASRRYQDEVGRDAELARSFGLETVPAVFVNGLYAGAGVEASDLVWLIETELERLGVDSPRRPAAERRTDEQLILRATLSSDVPGQGLAIISPSALPGQVGFYREGRAVKTGLVVRRIAADRIELLNRGQTEWLDAAGQAALAAPPVANTEDMPEASRALATPHRAVPVVLDRDEVLVRLSDRIGLEEVLAPVAMTTNGYRQLRLTEVRPGSLYELLGLEAGDVIVLVNEQPVHEADNPLWRALEKADEVRVRVMRPGGLAHHYTYRFDD